MPVFISYSQQDSDFVDTLAVNLVRARHHIWMDRWELNLGDSLTAKIEDSLTDSGAILVILSKHSVESAWCKRELTAGLVRELEERKTIVMPVVIDDCTIPLFLRDKLYADFRKDPDAAFSLIDRSLGRISNPATTRVEKPNFNTDFSIDWKIAESEISEETFIVRFTFVDHGASQPFIVLSECKIYEVEGDTYQTEKHSGRLMQFIRNSVDALYAKFSMKGELNAILEDTQTRFDAWTFEMNEGSQFLAVYTYRRLGMDTGMDTIVYLDNNLRMLRDHLHSTVRD